MQDDVKMVREFHEKFEIPNGNEPQLIKDYALKRIQWIREEIEEYERALESGNLVGVADALADIDYLLKGSINAHGLQDRYELIFKEVHRSNMTKQLNKNVEDAENYMKVQKGPNYQPPQLEDLMKVENAYIMMTHVAANQLTETDCWLPQRNGPPIEVVMWYTWKNVALKKRCRLCRITNGEIQGENWEKAILNENRKKIGR